MIAYFPLRQDLVVCPIVCFFKFWPDCTKSNSTQILPQATTLLFSSCAWDSTSPTTSTDDGIVILKTVFYQQSSTSKNPNNKHLQIINMLQMLSSHRNVWKRDAFEQNHRRIFTAFSVATVSKVSTSDTFINTTQQFHQLTSKKYCSAFSPAP